MQVACLLLLLCRGIAAFAPIAKERWRRWRLVSWSQVGDTWSEVPIQPQSQSPTLAERIQNGESVLLLHHQVSPQECDELRQACIALAQTVQRSELGHHDQNQPTLVRLPTQAAAARAFRDKITCADPLPPLLDERLQRILQRTCEILDTHLSDISKTLFGSPSLAQLYQTSDLTFSAREPAINVYSAPGGEFLPHKDGESLTILIALSCPHQHFQGGGTAFWAAESYLPPSVVLKPPAGTALVFGGNLTHAGVAVCGGQRVVLVCSLSPAQAVKESVLADQEDDDDLSRLLQNAAADWYDKWSSSELRDICPDL